MKKITFIIALLTLTACANRNVNINTAADMLFTEHYSPQSVYESDEYSAVIEYSITNEGEYTEKTNILTQTEHNDETMFRYINVNDTDTDIKWYDPNLNSAFSPYAYEDITRKTETIPLISEKGGKLYPEDNAFAYEMNSDTAEISCFYADIDNDGTEDTISFLTAPWIQGQNHNIYLKIHTSDNKTVSFSEPVYLIPPSENGIVFVNICRTASNGFLDFETEAIDYETALQTVMKYSFNGKEYIPITAE